MIVLLTWVKKNKHPSLEYGRILSSPPSSGCVQCTARDDHDGNADDDDGNEDDDDEDCKPVQS